MTRILRVNTSVDIAVGPFVDRGDGVTAIAIATANITPGAALRIKKNSAAWVTACSEVWRQEDNGGWFYEVRLTAGDVDTLGHLMWTNYVLGSALPVWHDFHVVTTAAYNLHFNYPNQLDGDRITTDVVLWDHVSAAAVLVSANVGQWRGSVVTAMPGSYFTPQNANLISWLGVTVQAITTANLAIPADIIVWAHSSVSAMPGGYTTIQGSDIRSWAGVTVQAITTANLNIPADVIVWEHSTANALIAGRVDANVGAMQADTITNAALADATQIKADVVAWSDVTVQAITTANPYPSVDVVLWAHSSVSAMPGPAAAAASRVNVIAWQDVTVQAITTANLAIPADVIVWAHSTVSAMPPGTVTVGSVNVNSWAGTSVAAVVTAGWPRVEVASYAAGEAPLQPSVDGRKLAVAAAGHAGIDWATIGTPGATQNLSATTIGVIGAGGISAGSFAAGAVDANALAADAVDEILDDALEGTTTVRQALRIMMAALAGKLSGAATTTVVIRDIGDTKNRITATVDANGNRTVVTLDGT